MPGMSLSLTPVGLVDDGNGGNNYLYTFVPVSTGVISPPSLTLSNPSGTVTTETPTFSWSEVSGATNYTLTIIDQGTQQLAVSVPDIGSTALTLSATEALTPGRAYVWSVTASVVVFGEELPVTSSVGLNIAPLGLPTTVSPRGSIASDRPTFTWTPVIDAVHTSAAKFILEVTDQRTGQVLTIPNLTGSSYTLTAAQTLTSGDIYTWSVTAVSTNGMVAVAGPSLAFAVNAQSIQSPVIIGEQAIIARKMNKKGKPVGKPVLQGFTLEFSGPMGSSAGDRADYSLEAIVSKATKKKPAKLRSVEFTVAYTLSDDNTVTINVAGNPTFANGGLLVVGDAVTSSAGATLSGNNSFSIGKKGTIIAPA
jgi:hypothetical protein